MFQNFFLQIQIYLQNLFHSPLKNIQLQKGKSVSVVEIIVSFMQAPGVHLLSPWSRALLE
jgi:hypothetical protein